MPGNRLFHTFSAAGGSLRQPARPEAGYHPPMPIERRDGYRLWIGGPVPKGSDGLTIGSMIMVRDGHENSAHLLRHERVHVRQWRRYGMIGFSLRYLSAYAVWRFRLKGHLGAYHRIPLEIEAEWVARRSLSTAVRDADFAAASTQL